MYEFKTAWLFKPTESTHNYNLMDKYLDFPVNTAYKLLLEWFAVSVIIYIQEGETSKLSSFLQLVILI